MVHQLLSLRNKRVLPAGSICSVVLGGGERGVEERTKREEGGEEEREKVGRREEREKRIDEVRRVEMGEEVR